MSRAPSKTAAKKDPFADAFKKVKPTFAQSNLVGAAAIETEPRFHPTDIMVGWAAIPEIDPSSAPDFLNKGYAYATSDMVTSDMEKAIRDGLICFPWYNEELHIDEKGRIRFKNMHLMVTKREWYEKRQSAVYGRIRDAVGSAGEKRIAEANLESGGARFDSELTSELDTIDAE